MLLDNLAKIFDDKKVAPIAPDDEILFP